MKKLLFIIMLVTFTLPAQVSFSFSADANKLTGAIDNPRTEIDHRGLDWDFEVGMNTEDAMLYLFIGGFRPANYYNYGLGLDLKKQLSKRFKIAVGNAIQYVERTGDYKYLDNGVRYFNPRGKISYDIWGRISVDLIAKLSCRPDIDKCIKEGQVGLTYTFKDGWN